MRQVICALCCDLVSLWLHLAVKRMCFLASLAKAIYMHLLFHSAYLADDEKQSRACGRVLNVNHAKAGSRGVPPRVAM